MSIAGYFVVQTYSYVGVISNFKVAFLLQILLDIHPYVPD